MTDKNNRYYRLPARIQRLVQQIKESQPWLDSLTNSFKNYDQWCESLEETIRAMDHNLPPDPDLPDIAWQRVGLNCILDYLSHRHRMIPDPFQGGSPFLNESFKPLWMALSTGRSDANEHYFRDMYHLFQQATGEFKTRKTEINLLKDWMQLHPTGLDPEVVAIRATNKSRILGRIKEKVERGESRSPYTFPEAATEAEKGHLMQAWWSERKFHLRFAVRDPETLNEYLDYSLTESTMRVLRRASDEGIPFFINTYYLSLLNTSETTQWIGSDLAIREYIIYNRDILEEYGNIEAWEKEDQVVPGEPNAAGWILPYQNNLHRRYPEVAIMIPDTLGRTCGGLCVSCQRMYEFQSGALNFDLDRTISYEKWGDKLEVIMEYFRTDTQLRDILITGGDALMSRDKALHQMFHAILKMAQQKRTDNLSRLDGEKYAEIKRIRLGTRLPAYLPQRVTPELIEILTSFRKQALKLGIRQFVIQTHFESSMEVTPESVKAIQMLSAAGWLVTNQHVFTVASSRRGHLAKLRHTLTSIGVMPYYTFSVKGFLENRHNFATHARLMQEKHEEKALGHPTRALSRTIREKASKGELTAVELSMLMKQQKLPFIASDRSMMNLPGIGKSMTFKTIGITPDGRRILEFDYDHSRKHSPVIDQHHKVIIVESKPVGAYLQQVKNMGDDPTQYESIWGYSSGVSESLNPLFAYPDYPFRITDTLNHIDV
jgi:lysine 2,3-aminomutase